MPSNLTKSTQAIHSRCDCVYSLYNLLHSVYRTVCSCSCRVKCDTRSTRRHHYRHTRNNVSDFNMRFQPKTIANSTRGWCGELARMARWYTRHAIAMPCTHRIARPYVKLQIHWRRLRRRRRRQWKTTTKVNPLYKSVLNIRENPISLAACLSFVVARGCINESHRRLCECESLRVDCFIFRFSSPTPSPFVVEFTRRWFRRINSPNLKFITFSADALFTRL